jgi:hypothetical protein
VLFVAQLELRYRAGRLAGAFGFTLATGSGEGDAAATAGLGAKAPAVHSATIPASSPPITAAKSGRQSEALFTTRASSQAFRRDSSSASVR